MTVEEDWSQLNATLKSAGGTNSLCFGSGLGTPSMKLELVQVKDEFARRLATETGQLVLGRDYSLAEYAVGARPEDELQYVPQSEIEFAEVLTQLASQPAMLPPFSGSAADLRDVDFQLLRLSRPGRGVATFVRKVTTGRFILTEQRGFASWFRQGVLDELEQDVVHMDSDFHGVHFGATWFVLRLDPFERLFGFAHHHVTRARESLVEIAQQLPFDAPDRLADELSQYVRLRRGIEEARQLGLFSTISVASLKKFAAKEGIPVAFTKQQGKDTIVVPSTSEGRTALVHLLRDAFVESSLSRSKYVADSKRKRA